jgi:hypothetical protein
MYAGVSVVALTFGTLSEAVHADEAGVSYWLPGRFGSLAAAPTVPGWSMAEVYYHTTVAASGAVAAAREIQIGRIGRHAGLSEPEGLRRIRRRQSGFGVECMADVLDLADGARQHRSANAPNRDEVTRSIVRFSEALADEAPPCRIMATD